jgi:hypothetical protein
MSGSAKGRNHGREAIYELQRWQTVLARSSEARVGTSVFSLDNRLHGSPDVFTDPALSG